MLSRTFVLTLTLLRMAMADHYGAWQPWTHVLNLDGSITSRKKPHG